MSEDLRAMWGSKVHELATFGNLPSNGQYTSVSERAVYGAGTCLCGLQGSDQYTRFQYDIFPLRSRVRGTHHRCTRKHSQQALRKTCYGLLTQQRPLAPFQQRILLGETLCNTWLRLVNRLFLGHARVLLGASQYFVLLVFQAP